MRTLIDGDIIVYRSAFACEQGKYDIFDTGGNLVESFQYKCDVKNWIEEQQRCDLEEQGESKEYVVEHQTVVTADSEEAKSIAKCMVQDILLFNKANSYDIFLSGGGSTFRHKLDKDYKAHRVRVPVYKDVVRDYLVDTFKAEITPSTHEADDLLGITQYNFDPYETIICSIDKDLRMIPGRHYNILTRAKSTVSKEEAMSNFLRQMLIGDRVDNIKGIKGIGEKKAKLIVDNFPKRNPFDLIAECYEINGLTVEQMDTTARLLWILRTFEDIELTSLKDILDKYWSSYAS